MQPDMNQPKGGGEHSSILHLHPPGVAPPSERVSVKRKLAYGFGGLSDFLLPNTVNALAIPIYSIALAMDPLLLGIAMAGPRVVGAISDPLAGTISDNMRTRWGRRRPFILGGAVGRAVTSFDLDASRCHPDGTFPLSPADPLGVCGSLFGLSVPHGALGSQLTTNYDERTRVMTWRGYVQTAGTLTSAWFYWFCLLPVFGNEVVGALAWRDRGARRVGGSRSHSSGLQGRDGDVCQAT